jgi:hypothetical protein
MKFSEKDFEFAPSWRPEPGDILQGRLAERTTRDGGYGEYEILTVDVVEPARTKDEMVTGDIARCTVFTPLSRTR